MTDTRYTRDHEWVRLDEDGIAVVGITAHAQDALGDIVHVSLPAPGQSLGKGEACAVVESVKAASDIYAPLAGTVTQAHDALIEDPAMINQDAEGKAWFFKLRLADPAAFAGLMDAAGYKAFLETI